MRSDQQAVEAALLWDVPGLRRLGAGGEALVAAFGAGGGSEIWWKSAPTEDDVLSTAAAAVRAERRGETVAAVERYERLAAGCAWARLLAASLRAWSPTAGGRDAIVEAARIVAELQPRGALAPWMHCRLMTCAYDHGLGDLVGEHLRLAVDRAGPSGQLHLVLVSEAFNLLGEHTTIDEFIGQRLSDFPYDKLVFRDEIDSAALSSARAHLADALIDRAQTPWRATIRIGGGPLDELEAADIQATWCGAFWQRRNIRRQLAAAALLNEPRDSDQAAWALGMWIEAGGREIERVADLVEPQLVQPDIDGLLQACVSRIAPDETRLMSVARMASTFWDRCSDDMAQRLLAAVPLGAGNHPLFHEGRRAVNRLGRRLPGAYERRIATAPSEVRGDLADDLTSLEARSVTQRAAQLLLSALGPESDHSTRVLLLQRVGSDETVQVRTDDNQPSDLLLAATIHRRAVSLDAIEQAVGDLIAATERAQADARDGRHGLGTNIARSLAQGLLLLGPEAELQRRSIDALLQLAESSAVASEQQVAALGALALVGVQGRLSDDDRARIRRGAPTSVELFPVSPDRLEAMRLLALTPKLLSVERVRLVVLGRSGDPTARHAAVDAAGLARHMEPQLDDEMLTWAILNALFDPVEDVVAKGVEAVDHRMLSHPAYGPLVVDRLGALQANRGRRTRTAIASALARLTTSSTTNAMNIATLLDAARNDGSWLVRQALASSSEP